MSNKSLPTVDEIVSSIKRSYIPILIIEGNDDVFIYRWLKSKISSQIMSIQPCGGRNNLFLIHDRLAEYSDKNVIFVADKDAYVFDGIPDNRNNIIFTSGYCIENDIYAGSAINELLDDTDRENHNILISILIKWFSFEIERYKNNKNLEPDSTPSVSNHLNEIIPLGEYSICPSFCQRISFTEPTVETVQQITDQYQLKVRGKQLFQTMSRIMSGRQRFSSFSDKNLIEVALKQGENHFINELIRKLSEKIAA